MIVIRYKLYIKTKSMNRGKAQSVLDTRKKQKTDNWLVCIKSTSDEPVTPHINSPVDSLKLTYYTNGENMEILEKNFRKETKLKPKT